jgi:hypothetical protein
MIHCENTKLHDGCPESNEVAARLVASIVCHTLHRPDEDCTAPALYMQPVITYCFSESGRSMGQVNEHTTTTKKWVDDVT